MPGPRPNPAKPHSRAHREPAGAARRVVVTLPAECTLPVPDLPAGRRWKAAERALWQQLWTSPQATQWDDSFVPAVAQYVAHSCTVMTGKGSAWMAQEARHLGDRLGLTPQGMTGLGWRFEPLLHDEPAPVLHLHQGGTTS